MKVKTEELVVLGGIGLGLLMFTRQGKEMLEDLTGINIEDITGIDFEINDLLNDDKPSASREVEKSPSSKKHERSPYPDDIYSTGPVRPEGNPSLYNNPDYHFPIQDLYIPPRYYDIKYETDTNRIPSPEFWDWYQKGSAGYLEDYVYPEHHYWNPDYYYYFGNLYKKWYPNVYEISHVPPNRVPYWFGEIYY